MIAIYQSLYFGRAASAPTRPPRSTFRAVVANFCRVAAPVSLGAAVVLVATRPKRLPAGHCRSCGYDLRANAARVRCPECGAAPSPWGLGTR
ncbi:MAG TPA: hypothetical protein VEB22_01685 [Phycisphaerales bacterium]|nr:hypothetical protein [Phycisphaerales bacterium]